jgi:hypothetical protein
MTTPTPSPIIQNEPDSITTPSVNFSPDPMFPPSDTVLIDFNTFDFSPPVADSTPDGFETLLGRVIDGTHQLRGLIVSNNRAAIYSASGFFEKRLYYMVAEQILPDVPSIFSDSHNQG